MATYAGKPSEFYATTGGVPKEGAWYSGQQYWGGTLSTPGQINTQSNQPGAGQMVSPEVNAQSAALQGKTPQEFEAYLQQQRNLTGTTAPTGGVGGAGGTTGGTGVQGTGGGLTTPSTINLPDLYKGLYESSGINTLQTQYDEMQKAFTEARAKNNDNPFLSEASRVGREAKLTQLFNERSANTLNQIATKKADIETQLNLQTKQFDIESQAAQNSLSQLNSLLNMGALSNVSGETIASLTRSTGISSDMIYSAIAASKKKDNPVSVMTSTGENGEVWAVALDSNGNVVNKQSLGVIGNVQQGKQATEKEELQSIKEDVMNEIRGGLTLADTFRIASMYLDANTILQLYNVYSPYGPAEESATKLEKYGIKSS